METLHLVPQSYLFTIRLWAERNAAGQIEWRGKIQLVVNGEARYFHSWLELITRIEELLSQHDGDDIPYS